MEYITLKLNIMNKIRKTGIIGTEMHLHKFKENPLWIDQEKNHRWMQDGSKNHWRQKFDFDWKGTVILSIRIPRGLYF